MRSSLVRVATGVILLGVLVLIGCDRGPIAEKSVVLSGHVVDAETGSGLDSAWVVLGDTLTAAMFYSDSTGAFALASFPFLLPQPLLAGRAGYETVVADTFQDVHSNMSGIRIELDKVK